MSLASIRDRGSAAEVEDRRPLFCPRLNAHLWALTRRLTAALTLDLDLNWGGGHSWSIKLMNGCRSAAKVWGIGVIIFVRRRFRIKAVDAESVQLHQVKIHTAIQLECRDVFHSLSPV